MNLVWPSQAYLPGYVAALTRGWSPDNLLGEVAARGELDRIARDPDAFLRALVDLDGAGDPITLPDGSEVPRLPGTCDGSGMASSVAASGSAGRPERKISHRRVLDTSGMRSCRGSAGADMLRRHCASS